MLVALDIVESCVLDCEACHPHHAQSVRGG